MLCLLIAAVFVEALLKSPPSSRKTHWFWEYPQPWIFCLFLGKSPETQVRQVIGSLFGDLVRCKHATTSYQETVRMNICWKNKGKSPDDESMIYGSFETELHMQLQTQLMSYVISLELMSQTILNNLVGEDSDLFLPNPDLWGKYNPEHHSITKWKMSVYTGKTSFLINCFKLSSAAVVCVSHFHLGRIRRTALSIV